MAARQNPVKGQRAARVENTSDWYRSQSTAKLRAVETGGHHVSRHNPYHYFDSRFDRRHSDLGSQPGLGLWSFGNCGGHSRDTPHIVAAGQDLAGLLNPPGGARLPSDGGKNVFVHISSLERASLSSLKEGQKVKFEIARERGKDSAAHD